MAQAKVLRLLRSDARAWWYYADLRKWGQVEKARELERKSIRDHVRFIRENIGRRATTYRVSVIDFEDRPQPRPFDLSVINPYGGNGYTASVSGCHPGGFAAWVYCYANRIGLKYTAKQSDRV